MDHFYLHSAILCSRANSLCSTSMALKGLTILTGSLVPMDMASMVRAQTPLINSFVFFKYYLILCISFTSCYVCSRANSLCFTSAPQHLKPILNGANVCSPNILRTVRRSMIRFLIEPLVRRTWFGQSKLYFVLNWLVMRCKLRPELAADAQLKA